MIMLLIELGGSKEIGNEVFSRPLKRNIIIF